MKRIESYCSILILTTLAAYGVSRAGVAYEDPPGGWTYTYHGDSGAAGNGGYTALDGAWSHDNNSDQWDGTPIGSGRPGGATVLAEGRINFLRLQDTGNPTEYGMPDPGSNRKIMFGHSITSDIGSWGDRILDDGITISFRARISTTPPLDDLYPDGGGGIAPWPAGGDGYVTHDGGKGNFSIRQSGGSGGKIISFTLAREYDHSYLGDKRGLAMNSTDGNTPSENVDIQDSEGMLNILELEPTEWHEFWITIERKRGRAAGTHVVNICRDGSTSRTTFQVTAGTGYDYPDSYIAMGLGATPQSGAIDIDFFSYKPGIFPPVDNANKWSQPPIEIYPDSGTPVYCGWDESSYRKLSDSVWFDFWDCRTQCSGDADCDGYVGSEDMTIVQAAYGTSHTDSGYDPRADFDRNLKVDQFDVMIMQNNWEKNPLADCSERPEEWKIVADDFRCFGTMPVASVRWWGSYVGWMEPDPPPAAMQPVAWHIGFWSNVPADVVGFSYPERLLWSINVPAERVRSEYAGYDHFEEKPADSCFRYEVQLNREEYFRQDNYRAETGDDTFWISIVALYPDSADISNPWGWKTRALPWMDCAVSFTLPAPPHPDLPTDPNFVIPIENVSVCGYEQPFDVAFELGTDPDYIKAAQPFNGLRNWPDYEGYESMAYETPSGDIDYHELAADDWLCERRTPVTAAVWWGAYWGHGHEACTCPVEEEPNRPDYFLLAIWSNDSDDGLIVNCPNEVVWEYKAYDYDEVMVGYDRHPICMTCDDPNRPVFRYSVRLPRESWFQQKDVNEIYWFSVTAVYIEPNKPTHLHRWHWENHERVSENESVRQLTSVLWVPNPEDMSFVLFTDPGECISCADYNSDSLVNFTDYADFSDDWKWTGPPGGYNNSDLNCDGIVDFTDTDIFTHQWLSTCP